MNRYHLRHTGVQGVRQADAIEDIMEPAMEVAIDGGTS